MLVAIFQWSRLAPAFRVRRRPGSRAAAVAAAGRVAPATPGGPERRTWRLARPGRPAFAGPASRDSGRPWRGRCAPASRTGRDRGPSKTSRMSAIRTHVRAECEEQERVGTRVRPPSPGFPVPWAAGMADRTLLAKMPGLLCHGSRRRRPGARRRCPRHRGPVPAARRLRPAGHHPAAPDDLHRRRGVGRWRSRRAAGRAGPWRLAHDHRNRRVQASGWAARPAASQRRADRAALTMENARRAKFT